MTDLSAALVRAGALIQRLQDHGLLDDRRWTISEEPHSPWILVDAEPVLGGLTAAAYVAYHFAIWRRTADLYVVGPDGAVGEDPINIGDIAVPDTGEQQ